MNINKILIELRCKDCNEHFLYCRKSGPDFRCYKCRKRESLELIQKELEEMELEEYQSFMQDIREYEDGLEEKRSKRLERK